MWFRRYPSGQTDTQTHAYMFITILRHRSRVRSNKERHWHEILYVCAELVVIWRSKLLSIDNNLPKKFLSSSLTGYVLTSLSKTEFMWLGVGHLLQQVDIDDIPFLYSTVKVVQSVRDLGVTLDIQLSLCHIATIWRAGFYQLRLFDQLFSHLLLMLLKLSFWRSLHVGWTGATRCSMVCRRTCWGRCSRCRTLPLVYTY